MAKPLSLNEIRSRAARFALDWKDAPGDERQEAQSFVRDLLKVYGLTETRAASYEKRARRSSTAGSGYIDALVPGQLLIEMKSSGKDLVQAERQALDYIDDLTDVEQPRYVLTSDFKKFRLLDVLATEGEDTTEWALEDLPLFIESLAFLAGYATRSFGSKEQERASVKAAQLMARLYESLEGSGLDDHDAGNFLVRTLFALYSDDSGVWERDLFSEFLETRTSEDGSDLGSQLVGLFQVMNTPVERRSQSLDELLARFPYVNGGIFEGAISIPYFDTAVRDQLIEAAAFDWREISPAIFGSLFQAVKSPEARRSLGEHYTTETNIKKTLGPLFLDELHDRFKASVHSIKDLKKLRSDLGEIRVLDPACGSGNFLIVAYRELRQLELDILLRVQELGDTSSIPTLFFEREDLAVRLDHMAGIEIEEWPAQIARTALRLTDHQANMAMEAALGKAPATLPLDTINVIHVGNALTMDWESVMQVRPGLMVVGNPPFIGQSFRSAEQTHELQLVWGNQYMGGLDYVTGWFKKTADFLAGAPGTRFAFVSTNSITQGQSVPALFKPLLDDGWRIRFAHQTFAWTSETTGAAAVHCVIVGFDREPKTPAKLFVYSDPKGIPAESPVTKQINGYLLDAPNLFVEARSRPLNSNLAPFRFGSKPVDGGNLIVERSSFDEVSNDPVAAKYLHRFVMGKELINDLPRWCLWLVDADPADLRRSHILKSRIERVRDMRAASTKKATQEIARTPYLFGENHQPSEDYVGMPAVFSETRHFATVAYLPPDVIAGNKVYTCVDPQGFAFAIASSSMLITWQKAIGGRLKSDMNFSNTLVWNNLPLPPVPDELHKQIIDTGQGVLDARNLHPERSLADHYDPLTMDPALIKAHQKLDRVVDKAFGAKQTLTSNEDRLKILFDRYAELTAQENK